MEAWRPFFLFYIMAREIKFRAFDDGAMTYSHNNSINHSHIQLSWFFNTIKFKSDIEPMQFTGLLDKNGREIYEGDICLKEGNPAITKASYLNMKYVVEFNTDYAEFRFKQLIPMVDGGVFIPRTAWDIEIIGNIYENPELINPKKD